MEEHDAQAERKCLDVGMKYEDVNVDEEGARRRRVRTLMSLVVPKLPPMRLRDANQGGEARVHVAHVQVSAAQALHRACPRHTDGRWRPDDGGQITRPQEETLRWERSKLPSGNKVSGGP